MRACLPNVLSYTNWKNVFRFLIWISNVCFTLINKYFMNEMDLTRYQGACGFTSNRKLPCSVGWAVEILVNVNAYWLVSINEHLERSVGCIRFLHISLHLGPFKREKLPGYSDYPSVVKNWPNLVISQFCAISYVRLHAYHKWHRQNSYYLLYSFELQKYLASKKFIDLFVDTSGWSAYLWLTVKHEDQTETLCLEWLCVGFWHTALCALLVFFVGGVFL